MPPAIAWTPTRSVPAAPPPPGFFENAAANFRLNEDRQDLLEQAPRNLEAYREALETLGDLGIDTSEDGPLYSTADSGTVRTIRVINRAAVFAEMKRQAERNGAYFKGLPATQEEYDREIARRFGGRDADLASAARGGTVSGLIGSAASGLTDPVNWITGLLGGGEAKLARFVLNEGMAGAIGGAALLPDEAAAMERMGEDFTAADMAKEVGMSAAGNVALGVAGKYVAAPALKPVARGAGELAGKVAQRVVPEERRLANAFAAQVPADSRTATERAALTILHREADIADANPFRPDGAGTKAHLDRLGRATAKLLDPGEARLAKPRPRPAGAVRPREPARLDTSIVAGLRARGFPEHVVRGVAAGIQAESRSNPNVRGGYKGRALGIGQWLGDRRAEIIRRYGENPTLEQQLDFIAWELRGGDYAGKKVLAQGDEASVLNSYIRDFMRPAKGRETSGDLERGMAALGRRGERSPEGAADGGSSAAPDWRGEMDARDAALAAERDALDAERAGLREARAARADGDEAAPFDPGPAPELRRDLFDDDASWRAAQRAVVGDDRPLVFHGTNRDFDQFEFRSTFRNDGGRQIEVTPQALFFSESERGAELFARDKQEIDVRLRNLERGEARVIAARLDTEQTLDFNMSDDVRDWRAEQGDEGVYFDSDLNPDAVDEMEALTGYRPEDFNDVQRLLDDPDVVAKLRDEGYDAVRLREDDGSASWAVFDPKAIERVAPADSTTAAASRPTVERQQATAREALAEWDDPAGPAAQAQAGSVLHDLKATVLRQAQDQPGGGPEVAVQLDGEGEAVSLEAMLDDIAEDFAIVAAIKGCL